MLKTDSNNYNLLLYLQWFLPCSSSNTIVNVILLPF